MLQARRSTSVEKGDLTTTPSYAPGEPARIDQGDHDRDGSDLTRTPLPKLQLTILLFIQLAEPIASTVIYPFVNQLVRETGITKGDERKTGYFAGER